MGGYGDGKSGWEAFKDTEAGGADPSQACSWGCRLCNDSIGGRGEGKVQDWQGGGRYKHGWCERKLETKSELAEESDWLTT